MPPTLTLKENRDKPIRQRHPWVFSGAVERLRGDAQPGDLVTVADHRGAPLATAYYNPKSQIVARVLSWDPAEPIDDAFWHGRLQRAIDGRAALGLIRNEEEEAHAKDAKEDQNASSRPLRGPSSPTTDNYQLTTAFRLVNAEADGLPGLIVDRYGDYLVMQCLTLGIDRRKAAVTEQLAALLRPAGVLERSDVDVRGKEGLKPLVEMRHGEPPPPELTIHENGHAFVVDVWRGHKTGFYLDQRDNRAAAATPLYLDGAEVLNVFAYSGAFGVYAAAAGAARVTQIDSSAAALELAERNMALNGFARPDDELIAGDAFEVLRYYREEGQQLSLIHI